MIIFKSQHLIFSTPDVLMKLVNLYATSFYGSNLWDLYSPQVDKIYKTWNVTVRNIFGLPWRTHRYWIETISGCLHPKTFLSSRYVKFVYSLLNCKKSAVRFLASLCFDDKRTLLGKTLSKFSYETSVCVDMLTPSIVKQSLRYSTVPEDQKWRVSLLLELLAVKENRCILESMTYGDIDGFISILAQD